MKKLFFIGILLFTLQNCTTIGNVFDEDGFNKIQIGMLEKEIITLLKTDPVSRSELANGTYLLQWMYTTGSMFGAKSHHIALLFGADNKLIKITHQTKL